MSLIPFAPFYLLLSTFHTRLVAFSTDELKCRFCNSSAIHLRRFKVAFARCLRWVDLETSGHRPYERTNAIVSVRPRACNPTHIFGLVGRRQQSKTHKNHSVLHGVDYETDDVLSLS